MSKLTEVLKLLCYDPETDGNLTFNVTEALTKNWEKIDQLVLLAVAAAAAYDPEGSYAVGDYCTYQGLLYKCNTAIPSGEPWTAEHWTETTVAAELAEVRASLSNKVAKTYTAPSQIGITLGSETIESISTALPNGAMLMYGVGASANTEIYPFRLCAIVVYRIDASRVVWIAIDKSTGKNATGNWSNDLGFTGWESSATATPPQEFDLPLADGFDSAGNASIYWKDQFGIVRVYVAVLKNSGTITNNEILGTLPEGFRPKHNFAVVGFGNSNQNNIADRHPINMIISSNGNITASFLSETDGTKIASLYGTAEFLPES